MYNCPSSGRFCARLSGFPGPIRNYHLFQKTKVSFIFFLLEHAIMIGLIEICHQSWIQRKRKSILFAFYIDWIQTYVWCRIVDWFIRIFFSRNEERLRRLEEKNYVSANFIATDQEPHQYSSLQDISAPPRPISSEGEGIEIH